MHPATARRRHVKRILLKRNGYQFGQPPGTCTRVTRVTPGDVACMDTSIQLLARLCRGRWYSLDFVRAKSLAPSDRPMPVGNAAVAMRRIGLPYVLRTGLSAMQIFDYVVKRGPVVIAEAYWSHPHWLGYRYLGRTMRGFATKPGGGSVHVGVARPLRRAGSNQWNFTAGHAVVLAWARRRPDGSRVIGVRDPNHNSAARPERPAWDEITLGQLARMLRSFQTTGVSVAWVPTEVVIKP